MIDVDAPAAKPSHALHNRRARSTASTATTTHFNGKSTASLNGETATSQGYNLAHHLTIGEDGQD